MIKSYVILMTLFYLFHCVVQQVTPDPDCAHKSGTKRLLKLTVNSKRNQTGDWEDTFAARVESSSSSESANLDVTHTVTECEGRRVIYIQGESNGLPIDVYDGLTFHPRCGTNIAILNKGRTVQKINLDDAYNGAVFTSRPLRKNEIFEIRLDQMNPKFGNSLGIGISTRNPAEVQILPEMFKSPHALLLHNVVVVSNDMQVNKNYGSNINNLKVGDRVGVMRSEFGTLHFFVNGVNQGAAASNIPSPVYGLVDLKYNAAKATIVNVSSPLSS